jgi:hypothetical protein
MIIRIDARRLSDSAALHATMSEAFGFPDWYGRNLDALVDCLAHLDDPKAGMSRVQVFPGQVALLALDHVDDPDQPRSEPLRKLLDVVAFVNWRRLEMGQPPVLALAYHRGSAT